MHTRQLVAQQEETTNLVKETANLVKQLLYLFSTRFQGFQFSGGMPSASSDVENIVRALRSGTPLTLKAGSTAEAKDKDEK